MKLPPHSPGAPGQDVETPAGFPVFLDDQDLHLLRQGPDRNTAYGRLHERCREHVLGSAPGLTLTPESAEAIVAQAVVDELPSLLDPKLDAAAVSRRLRTALARARARLLGERTAFEDTLAALAAPGGDEGSLASPLQLARALGGFIPQALDALRAEDRNLLIREYRLGRYAFDERGPAPAAVDLTGLGALRARKRFRRALDRLLGDAISDLDREASLLARLREAIRNPAFFRILAGSNRRSP